MYSGSEKLGLRGFVVLEVFLLFSTCRAVEAQLLEESGDGPEGIRLRLLILGLCPVKSLFSLIHSAISAF